jgi:exodeoxyribonuclease VII small subunit
MKIEDMSFEEAYSKLEETSAKLEKGNLSLEESLALYEEGVALSKRCEELLEKAELRVTQLTPGQLVEPEEAKELEDDDFI